MRRSVSVMMLAVFALLALAGCAPATAPTPAPGVEATATTAPTTAGGAPAMVWSRAEPCEGACGNPNLSAGGYVFHYAQNPAYLVSCSPSGASCNLPGLAERWEESEDHLTWTYYLRQDVKWSDGTPSNVDDHIFTINMVTHPEFGAQSYSPLFRDVVGYQEYQDGAADSLAGIERVDDYTFRLHLTVVKRREAKDFSGYFLLPYHRMKDQTMDEWKEMKVEDRISVGPYYFTDVVYNQYYAMKANPHFYLGKPQIEEFIYRAIPNWAVAIAGLKSGAVDVVDVTPLDEVAGLRETPSLQIVPDAVARGYLFWFNLREGRQLPLKVRQAMSLSLDRQLIIDTLWEGYGWTIMCQAQPDGVPLAGAINDPNVYDLERAQQLVAEAKAEGWNGMGWNGQDPIKLYYYYTTEFAQQLMSATAAMWREAGLDVDIELLPTDRVVEVFYDKGEYDVLYGCCADPGTSAHFDMQPLYSCAARYPAAFAGQGVCDPALDEQLEIMASTFDRQEEIAAIQWVCSYLNDNVITLVGWMSPGLWTINTRLGNTTVEEDGQTLFNKHLHTWTVQ